MPNAIVHRNARIRRAILDRDVEIPEGALIGYDPAEDRSRHTVTDNGVVVVTPGEECLVENTGG
jgi:glucose-1-phosphate adenylyltransferase